MRVNKGSRLLSVPSVFGGICFVFLALCLNICLNPSIPGNAKEAGAEVGVTVKEFIKLAVDTTNLALRDSNNNTSPVPTAAGTMLTGDLNIAVSTNTTKGYSLSAYTADNSTSMSNNRTGATTKIDSIASTTGYDATTGASDLSANTWGFQKYTSGSFSNWFGVGSNSENGTIIASTDSDDADFCENLSYPLANTGCSSGSYDTYTVKFGAKLTNTLPAGTYTNNVIFSAIAKSEGTKYTINFNANNANATGNTSPRTTIEGSTIIMPSSGYIVDGYRIKGWALVNGATVSTTPLYLAGSVVLVNDLISAAIAAGQSPATNNQIALYAVWEHYDNDMQNFNCASLASGGTATLRDTRDNQTYSVYRIPTNAVYPGTSTVANVAGKCFMTKDLNLGAVANTPGASSRITPNGTMILSPNDSGFTAPDGVDYEGITVPTSDVTVTNGTGSWTSGSTNTYANKKYAMTSESGYSGRGYYSWGAAMVVCPKGWRLPAGGEYFDSDSAPGNSATGITKLGDNNITALQNSPFYLVLNGMYYEGGFIRFTTHGYYWSSTQTSATNSRDLDLYADAVSKGNNAKYFGFPVRCISD